MYLYQMKCFYINSKAMITLNKITTPNYLGTSAYEQDVEGKKGRV